MHSALIFPGQGAQAVGMGKEFYDNFSEAREVFDEVSEALKLDMAKLIFHGEAKELSLTYNTQPALFCVSMAIFQVMLKQLNKTNLNLSTWVKAAAGHSLGEYSALCAAGALTIAQGAKLLQARGQAMHQACPDGGAMAAVLDVDVKLLQDELLPQVNTLHQLCVIANDNAPGQIVVSGHLTAINQLIDLAKHQYQKRALRLEVSSAFHSPLMQPAASAMKQHLLAAKIEAPHVMVVTNVTAEATQEPEVIRELLQQQICGRVRWRESINYLSHTVGITTFIEVGAGKVLTNLNKRINPELNGIAVNHPNAIEELLQRNLL